MFKVYKSEVLKQFLATNNAAFVARESEGWTEVPGSSTNSYSIACENAKALAKAEGEGWTFSGGVIYQQG